jgi:hypothetical protein
MLVAIFPLCPLARLYLSSTSTLSTTARREANVNVIVFVGPYSKPSLPPTIGTRQVSLHCYLFVSGMDAVPEPEIICAALRAARRLNDFALTTRFLESVKEKCGNQVDKIYPYILQEIRPLLDELGINTPEELGYDKPELWLENAENMH